MDENQPASQSAWVLNKHGHLSFLSLSNCNFFFLFLILLGLVLRIDCITLRVGSQHLHSFRFPYLYPDLPDTDTAAGSR